MKWNLPRCHYTKFETDVRKNFEKYNITKCRPSLVKDEFFNFLYTVLGAYEFENCIEKQFKAAIVSRKRLIINKCTKNKRNNQAKIDRLHVGSAKINITVDSISSPPHNSCLRK